MTPPSPRDIALAGHRGDLAAAREGLSASDPAVRVTALGALARLDRLGAADLHAALLDPDAAVRRRAAEEAGRHPRLAVDLRPALADHEPTVVETAAWACGERPDDGAVVVADLARVATGHEDPLCREAAVAALGALGDDRGLAAILTATGDKPAVRRRAIIALAPFEGENVDAALQRGLEDRDRQVRQAAEDLLSADD